MSSEKNYSGGAATSNGTSDDAAPFAYSIYEMTVKANTGLELCKGLAKMIYSDRDLNMSGKLTA